MTRSDLEDRRFQTAAQLAPLVSLSRLARPPAAAPRAGQGTSAWSPTRRPRRPTRRSSPPSRHAGGQGRRLQPVLRRLRRPGEAVEAGLTADVVALSLAPDVDKLVEAKKVAAGWNKDKYDGFVTNSVVVFAVRKGNPKNIKTWDDLIKDGVEVIEPNPFTSGGAKWNIMAAYGAQLEQGKSEQQAEEYLRQLFQNVPVQDKSAREALQTFIGGKGDVLLAYENEAITAQQKDEDVDYVVPDQTILIQNPIAVPRSEPTKAQAFVDFTRSEQAQKIFAEKGYRSVIPSLVDESKYPTPPNLFEITQVRWLGEGQRRVLRPRQGTRRRDREGPGCRD